ncbi:alpha-amylase family protein [Microbispora sp. H10830]|uniref:alpha-amylase family protein n=1 Tax=Microbispora sp. H10830 TaxID=2729109 RepID=UPI0016041D11|nr:alpha-amylase family protein [Microbispora sp. H10830]
MLPRRTVHLDFHTGPQVPEVGTAFEPDAFARTLVDSHTESVTLFAKCHHGLLYYETDRPERHPGLAKELNLLDEQIEALRGAGIRTPVYLSFLVDEYAAELAPEWIALEADGRQVRRSRGRFDPGWYVLDPSSPYQDYFADQLNDVLAHFGTVDGIFIDMCWDQPSASKWAVDGMRRAGLDPADAGDRNRYARKVAHEYMARYRDMIVPHLADDAPMSVWFNSRPKTALGEEVGYVSHVEIEALPTGGWGYGYLPYVSRFVRPLGVPALAHTGRFHKSWGDNGGLKPPAALKYECAQMLAYGLTAGVGDLLHPSGRLNPETYELIGDAYAYLKRCEPHVEDAAHVRELAVLMDPALGDDPGPVGTGLVRALQQLRLQFDVLAPDADLSGYRAVVVPESTPLTPDVIAYAEGGGAVLVAGQPFPGVAAQAEGEPLAGTFLRPAGRPEAFPYAMYEPVRGLLPEHGAEALYEVVEPYFPRSWDAFSGHDYTPAGTEPSRYAAAVVKDRVAVVAAPIFTAYGRHAPLAYLAMLRELFGRILPDPVVRTGGPSHLEAVVVDTPPARIVHLLSFLPSRQAEGLSPITLEIEGIDLLRDPFPLVSTEVAVRSDAPPAAVRLEPHGIDLPFTHENGYVHVTVDVPDGHGMVVVAR